MYLKRNSETFLEAWKEKKNRKPLILRGARQTGKTTLVKQLYPDIKYINLDAPENREFVRNIPPDFLFCVSQAKSNILEPIS